MVAIYKGEDWASWDQKKQKEFGDTFLKWFDESIDQKLSKEEL